ncbi:tripeptidyl-peptidase 1 [Xylariaceae sp. FL0804]|nr:tripeptidyl-peptidase 1 [Xylariaceae sp. FL0804]
MRAPSAAALLCAAAAAGVASAKVMDSLSGVPAGWTELRPAAPREPITLRLAMPQQHADELEQAVIDMSTPGHPSYGKHMGRLELRSYTAPTEASVSAVVGWLAESDIEASVNNDWITFTTDVGRASALLDTTFAWYRYGADGRPQLRTLAYSVPDALAAHVDLVQPTTRFGQPAGQRSTVFDVQPDEAAVKAVVDAKVADCSVAKVTPDCIKSLYNISYTAAAEGNLVAFASYLYEYARYDDLQSFEEQYVPQAEGQNFSVTLINGGLNSQTSTNDSGEANLDVQYILGVSNPIPILEYSTGGLGPLVPTEDEPGPTSSNEPYLEFLTYVLDQDDADLPQTLSTSYGEEEQSVPSDYALKICNMFMQLGARGVSVLFSSGDSGPGDSCVRESDGATYFQPTFPAGCPYVTAVGATHEFSPESAASFSSGGFSTLWARPSWQDDAVGAYLDSLGDTYAAYFNASGRGIPDVAAQGELFAVVDQGSNVLESGTSASSPTFAGVVALLNAARLASGLAPLGFLNPWLYNNTAALTDTAAGYSSGCTSNSDFGRSGARWNATDGWDPATGLGTPNFGDLLAVAAPGVANA